MSKFVYCNAFYLNKSSWKVNVLLSLCACIAKIKTDTAMLVNRIIHIHINTSIINKQTNKQANTTAAETRETPLKISRHDRIIYFDDSKMTCKFLRVMFTFFFWLENMDLWAPRGRKIIVTRFITRSVTHKYKRVHMWSIHTTRTPENCTNISVNIFICNWWCACLCALCDCLIFVNAKYRQCSHHTTVHSLLLWHPFKSIYTYCTCVGAVLLLLSFSSSEIRLFFCLLLPKFPAHPHSIRIIGKISPQFRLKWWLWMCANHLSTREFAIYTPVMEVSNAK